MPTWPDFDPRGMLGLLTARGVDFVVIGGYAAALHGSPRITQDLDVLYAAESANLTALARVLEELNARLSGVDEELPFKADERTLASVELLTLETDRGRLDLMTAPDGRAGYERVRRRAARFDIGGFEVSVAEIGDLIAMKEATGRPKDLADVAELEAIGRLRRR